MAGDFTSAWQLIHWAREDINSLDAACEAFLRNNPYSLGMEDDPESGDVFLKLRMSPVPDQVCKLASHALWDIKHALDHAACAAVRAIRGDQITDVHFPIGSHPNDFEAKLRATLHKGDSLKYPALLHDTFRGFESYPTGDGYPGGGDEFCALSKLANTTKHSIALDSVPRFDIASLSDKGGLYKIFMRTGGKNGGMDRLGLWDGAKKELTIGLARRGSKLDMNIQIASFIAFSEVKIFQDYAAGEILAGYVGTASDVISELEKCVA